MTAPICRDLDALVPSFRASDVCPCPARHNPRPTLAKARRVRGNGTIAVNLRPESCYRFFIHGTNPPVGHAGGVDARPGVSTIVAQPAAFH